MHQLKKKTIFNFFNLKSVKKKQLLFTFLCNGVCYGVLLKKISIFTVKFAFAMEEDEEPTTTNPIETINIQCKIEFDEETAIKAEKESDSDDGCEK